MFTDTEYEKQGQNENIIGGTLFKNSNGCEFCKCIDNTFQEYPIILVYVFETRFIFFF